MPPVNPNAKIRGWLFTWNNYPATYRDTLDELECRYVCAGEEIAPTTGTPHLQGYVYFSAQKRLSSLRRLLPGCHLLPANGTAKQNRDYCAKSRDVDEQPNAVFYERGNMPVDAAAKGEAERVRWQTAWDNAKLGNIEAIPVDIRVRQYSAIRRIQRDYMPSVESLSSPCGVWIYGLSGAGKSRSVMDAFPTCYPKPRTQWWDGYQGESVVLLDDVDKFDVRLGGYLKHWADCYPFIGEDKGGSKKIRPLRFFVTSQYRIEEIWEDEKTRDALLRRFHFIEKIEGQGLILC